MIRKIIRIDEERCTGCGLCAGACHEGAIAMENGKAKLAKEHYCDGLGDCLPVCPAGAITFEEREAPAYDAAAVARSKAAVLTAPQALSFSAPGLPDDSQSRLSTWPVQLKLLPARAPMFRGADLLIAADCTAYAYGNFHRDFIAGRAVAIGCPKLDGMDYSEKLTHIFAENEIRSITLTRMDVPCCGGLEFAVRKALEACGKSIPCRVVTIDPEGHILNDT